MHAVTHVQDHLKNHTDLVFRYYLKHLLQNYEIYIGDGADYREFRVRQDSG